MQAHEAMLRHIRAALKPTGRLVLVERIANEFESSSREEQIKIHQLSPKLAKRELEDAGFEVIELHDRFFEPDGNRKSRWWLLVAEKTAR